MNTLTYILVLFLFPSINRLLLLLSHRPLSSNINFHYLINHSLRPSTSFPIAYNLLVYPLEAERQFHLPLLKE